MKKFFKKPKSKLGKLSDEQKIKMAEEKLTDKVNSLAEFLESQKEWNLADGYCVLKFVLHNSIIPQLKKKRTAYSLAQQQYNSIVGERVD